MIPQATTIDEVIILLEEIIIDAKKQKSTKGYFAVLYLKVTKKVKDGIAQNIFENGSRMEKLDVIFANRYINAYYQYCKKEPAALSWESAFKEADNNWMTVLQHLLLGMNAHINLDLGIAAAQIEPKKEILSLEKDFITINTILSSLVADVERDLTEVWPTLKWILLKTNGVDSFLVDFSMRKAREGSWKYALEYSPLNLSDADTCIANRDTAVAKKAKLITNIGWLPVIIFKIIRIFETGDVAQKILKLED